MTKKHSAKYWITSISATVIVTGIVLACAGDWGPEYGTSNFTPETIVRDSTYSPFFYSNEYYYGIGHDENHNHRFDDANTAQWATWLGKDVPDAALRYLLGKAPQSSIDSAINWITAPAAAAPAALRGRAMENARGSSRFRDFLAYLQLARQAEGFALNESEGWYNYEDAKKKRKTIDAMAFDQRLVRRKNIADSFLQNRYWFQRVRNFYFNGSPRQAIDLFEQQQKQFPRDDFYYRTMSYAAGAWYKLKNYSKANYYYSLVYAGCPAMRTVAHYSFHPQEQTDWKATLALCANNAEKATCWQMLGIFYGDEGRSIQEIYKLDPRSPQLDLLLVRAVNIYEQKFGGTNVNDPLDIAVHRSDSAGKFTVALIDKIAREGRTSRPWIWNMAAGYLGTLDNKFTEANAWYDRTAIGLPKEPDAQAQLRLLRLINQLSATRVLDKKTEDKLRPELDWLMSLSGAQNNVFRYATALDWMRHRMAALYTVQKDYVKSECYVSTSKFYADDKRVLALQTFLNRAGKTPYENYCASISHINKNGILEYQAIKSAYAGNLEDAIAKFSMDTADALIILPGNPFNGRIQDCHDCDFSAPQKIKYSKLAFIKKCKEMKDKATAGQDVYTNFVLLGNAYYNMSHYGNARAFYESAVIGSGHSSADYIDSAFRNMLTSMTIAVKCYQQALKAAVGDEQKAKCQYMLAKCERNEWYNSTAGKDNQQLPDFLEWKGFTALRQYSSTQYYKEVLKECGYFNTYSQKHPLLYKP